MKYESCLTFRDRRYSIKAIDVLKYEKQPRELCNQVINDEKLNDYDYEIIYTQIDNVINITEQEIEDIKSICKAHIKNLKVEINNVELANYCNALCLIYKNAISENGLLQNVRWDELNFWDFIILTNLQATAIEEHNKQVEKAFKKR